MKKIRYSSALLVALFCFCLSTMAQVKDSRNRVASTIVADGLAQLPAQNLDTYNQVIGELAGTGNEGISSIVRMYNAAPQTQAATFEYALNGVASYVSANDKASMREGVHEALKNGLVGTSDKVKRQFLLSQLQKIVTTDDVPVLESLLNDKDLCDVALTCLCNVPGDDVVASVVTAGNAPKAVLAYLAAQKRYTAAQYPQVETALLSWLKGADATTKAAVYHALALCGSAKSLKTLQNAAKKVNFQNDATSATDSYLQYLMNWAGQTPLSVADRKPLQKAAAELLASSNLAVRNCGLDLMFMTDGYVDMTKALKNPDRQYRCQALADNWKYQGDHGLEGVMQAYPTLSDDAKTDVIRFFGNENISGGFKTVAAAMNSDNDQLANAAIEAAGKMGGNEAVDALVGQLGGKHAAQASEALLAFHGEINSGVVRALDNSNPAIQVQALKLISNRRVYSAYQKVLALTDSPDKTVQAAAYDALKGVVKAENFNQICDKMETADASVAPSLQTAALQTLHNDAADAQYDLINARMQQTAKAQLYYPLLAQAGSSASIDRLLEAYGKAETTDAAFQSLMKVDNSEMIDVLYELAARDATVKDQILDRYLTLVKQSAYNDVEKYLSCAKALRLQPSAAVTNNFLTELGQLPVAPSLSMVTPYLDAAPNAVAAANAVKSIMGKNAALQNGAAAKAALEKAKTIFQSEKAKGDADAGYAVDELNGMLAKASADGFVDVTSTMRATGKQKELAGKHENFELWMDWKSDKSAILKLRSMPELQLDGTIGVSYLYADETTTDNVNTAGEYNALYVKVLNDRLWVTSNGKKVVENAVLKNADGSADINVSGVISLIDNGRESAFSNILLKDLPSSPVYTLPQDEKAQGFEVLFDGRSLKNFHGNTVNYVPQDGTIYVSAGYGAGGNLYTNKKYSDFIYRFEFSFVSPGVNNGIGIRTKDGVDAAYDGMEIQVLDHDDPIYKGLMPYQQHGAVYGVIVPKHVTFGMLGTWNTEEIKAVGDHITVTVNGEVILDGNIREACKGHNVAPDGSENNPYTVDKHNHPGLFNKDGYISFCGHGEGVKFRNVRILDLSKSKTKKK